jgi:cytochrome c-type biogenesis protein CcmH/NrfG
MVFCTYYSCNSNVSEEQTLTTPLSVEVTMEETNANNALSRTIDVVAEKLHAYAQYIIIGAFGLLPLIFLPVGEFSLPFSLSFTKTFVALAAVLIAIVLYCFSVLRTGNLRVSFPLPTLVLWLIVVTSLASALISGDVVDALKGDTFEPTTVGFLATLALIVTVVPHILTDKRKIYLLYITLAFSTVLLTVFHIARLFFGPATFSFGVFGAGNVLTPVGSWNDLAIFLGLTILLAIVALEQLPLTKQGRIAFSAVTAIALAMLVVVNFSPVWYVLIVVSLVTLIYAVARDRFTPPWLKGGTRPEQFSFLSIAITATVFALSFVMIAGGSFIGGKVTQYTGITYVEVRPSLEATANIAKHTYTDHALFGIGPNKFIDAWRLFRDQSLNSTIFWNTDFLAGVGYIPSFFITLGIIGGVLWVLFLALFVSVGVKTLLHASTHDKTWYFIGVSAFVSGLYIWGLSVLYVPGPALILLAALTTGLLFSARNALEPHREHSLSLIGDRRSGFVLISIAMLAVMVSMGVFYTVGRQYAGAYVFAQGERLLVNGDVAGSITKTEEAALLHNDDRYYRRLAEIRYSELVALLNAPEGTPDVRARFDNALRSALQYGLRAVAIDGTDANNWSILGAVYSAVVPIPVENAYDQAKTALDNAKSLDPQNPIRTLMLARLSYAHKQAPETRAFINEAIRQKPDYIDATFMLSQLEIAEGNIDAAIDSTIRTIQIEPGNPARFFQLGVLYLAKNDMQSGITVLEQAVQLDPQYANARYYLAFAYDRIGQSDQARVHLEKVLETNPGNADVERLLSIIKEGKKISEPIANGQTPSVEQSKTVTEGNQTPDVKPDSTLLTPVNPIPEKNEPTIKKPPEATTQR